jgi:hypothetical protein
MASKSTTRSSPSSCTISRNRPPLGHQVQQAPASGVQSGTALVSRSGVRWPSDASSSWRHRRSARTHRADDRTLSPREEAPAASAGDHDVAKAGGAASASRARETARTRPLTTAMRQCRRCDAGPCLAHAADDWLRGSTGAGHRRRSSKKPLTEFSAYVRVVPHTAPARPNR